MRRLQRIFLIVSTVWLLAIWLLAWQQTSRSYTSFTTSSSSAAAAAATTKNHNKDEWSVAEKANLPKRSASLQTVVGGNHSNTPERQHQQQPRLLDEVCSTFPGHGSEEGGFMGYQVLVRMRHFLSSLPSTQQQRQQRRRQQQQLLCVWFEPQDAVLAATVQKLYAQPNGCDGILRVQLLAVTNNYESSSSSDQPRVVNQRNNTVLLQASSLPQVFRYIATNTTTTPYAWFHWTNVEQYLFLPQHLHWLLQDEKIVHATTTTTASSSSSASMIQPGMIEDSLEHNTKYHQLYGEKPSPPTASGGGCPGSQTGNRHVAQRLADCPVPWNGSVPDWIASCLDHHHHHHHHNDTANLTCHGPNPGRDRHTPWMFLRRYFEIRYHNASDDDDDEKTKSKTLASSITRLHAILHGECDDVWEQHHGALDQRGVPGYVHDPTFLRKNPPPFSNHVVVKANGEAQSVCEIPWGEGDEGRHGYRALQKIKLFPRLSSSSNQKKVLCLVYTHSGGHNDRVRAIAETWGPRCDGFMAASNQTDPSVGAVHLLHEGPEAYGNMWLKVRSMFQYVYDHYIDDYDFVHIGGDDHYVIPENLRYTVATGSWQGPWNDSEPLFLGGSLALGRKRRYCNGGSGYTLNRVALQLLVEELLATPRCMPHWPASYEDRLVASCFRSVGLQCMDTNDERNETRYHTWNAEQHAAWKIGIPAQDWTKLRDYHGIAWKEGLGQISESSVSFHLKSKHSQTADSGMRRYHAILYGLCNQTTTKE